jgi:hypothetical protein
MRPLLGLCLAGGCMSGAPELESPTEGGSWTVSMQAPQQEGSQVLLVSVVPEDGQLVSASVSMPSMGHTSDGSVAAAGPGAFEVTVDLSMPGWWVLDGAVARDAEGDGAEGFQLEFEVP